MIKDKRAAFVLYYILFMLLSNILSYFLHGHVFEFRVVDDLMIPAVVAAVIGYIFFLKK